MKRNEMFLVNKRERKNKNLGIRQVLVEPTKELIVWNDYTITNNMAGSLHKKAGVEIKTMDTAPVVFVYVLETIEDNVVTNTGV